jgi:hypothetical protein
MIGTASASISWRTLTGGQPRPTTCSLRFSPAPRPRVNRPPDSNATVAAFWATTAGWYRIVGHVTYVISPTRSVAVATAPSTLHA